MKLRHKTAHSVKSFLKALPVRHREGSACPIFLFATPRGGLTWLAETIFACPGMRCVSEPLNLRSPWVKEDLGVEDWNELWERDLERKLLPYFEELLSGRNRRRDLTPFRSPAKYGWRFRTDRTVFKVNNGGTQCLDAVRERFDARIILFFRHPIPTTLSREYFPGLEALPRSRFFAGLPDPLQGLTKEILAGGDHLEKGALAWCFHNAPLVEKIGDPEFLCLTYEEMVIDSRSVLRRVAEFCGLEDEERVIRNAHRPSSTTRKSEAAKRKILRGKNEEERIRAILGHWRRKVPPEEAHRIQPILNAFGIALYGPEQTVPTRPLALQPNQLHPFVSQAPTQANL